MKQENLKTQPCLAGVLSALLLGGGGLYGQTTLTFDFDPYTDPIYEMGAANPTSNHIDKLVFTINSSELSSIPCGFRDPFPTSINDGISTAFLHDTEGNVIDVTDLAYIAVFNSGGYYAVEFNIHDAQVISNYDYWGGYLYFESGVIPGDCDITGLDLSSYQSSDMGYGNHAIRGGITYTPVSGTTLIVPEPSTILLGSLGMAGLFVRRRN